MQETKITDRKKHPNLFSPTYKPTKIHEKYGSHWFYLTESLENIGGNKRIGGTFC